jgi:hypothetical protein
MSGDTLLATFATPERMIAAIRPVRAAGFRRLDAYAPFMVDGLADALGERPSRLGFLMAAAGFGTAALAYALQWYAAVVDYPFLVGGRPAHSWPVFVFFPFELGIFMAALAGVVGLLWRAGLPRLHDPLFAVPAFEAASGDRFLLTVHGVFAADDREMVTRLLTSLGAVAVREVEA